MPLLQRRTLHILTVCPTLAALHAALTFGNRTPTWPALLQNFELHPPGWLPCQAMQEHKRLLETMSSHNGLPTLNHKVAARSMPPAGGISSASLLRDRPCPIICGRVFLPDVMLYSLSLHLPFPCTYSLACSGFAWGPQALLLLCCEGPYKLLSFANHAIFAWWAQAATVCSNLLASSRITLCSYPAVLRTGLDPCVHHLWEASVCGRHQVSTGGWCSFALAVLPKDSLVCSTGEH